MTLHRGAKTVDSRGESIISEIPVQLLYGLAQRNQVGLQSSLF